MSSSSDEEFLELAVRTMRDVGLEAILIGNAGAALLGAPVTTADLDFLVRDTALAREKIKQFAARMGDLSLREPFQPMSDVIQALGGRVPIDFAFRLSSGRKFESLCSRARRVGVGEARVLVASLEDIIEAKRAANRPKDRAALPILEETLRVLGEMGRD